MIHADFPFVGIDYGSKLAGTTVLCYVDSESQFCILQSEKKRDADHFLLDVLIHLKPAQMFIDAPLSLPGSYYGKTSDFFYRQCDRLLGAMSPMFLGGLTARAIQLTNNYRGTWKEVYPSALVKEIHLSPFYHKKDNTSLKAFRYELIKHLPEELTLGELNNHHQADALLAWMTGWRNMLGKAHPYGQKGEGVIWV